MSQAKEKTRYGKTFKANESSWTWVNGVENKFPRGEVGILKWMGLSGIEPTDRCYLYIEHEGSTYLGCLLFDDHAFCRYIAKLLETYCNRPIAEIASLDLNHLR
jgi:hypothetical protein